MTVIPPTSLPPIVLMGVSGAGKTVVGSALADASGRVFIDGDDLHSTENKEKMRAGIPLTDADREPWLRIIGERLAVGDGVIVACSALRRQYRDLLRSYAPETFFAHLDPDPGTLEQRLAGRVHEYMPADLVGSQLATLEPLQPDEFGAVFRSDGSVDATVADIRAVLASDLEEPPAVR
ncbi:gluconokinase [Humibacter albus]|uniref:gluconokinase n=1 Tax=Humibacter albus TaxID=427754 RepID=UPI0003B596DF|nr:gluconokinase [Humibacter albus]